jgi:hypothetical protein
LTLQGRGHPRALQDPRCASSLIDAAEVLEALAPSGAYCAKRPYALRRGV